MKAPEKLYLRKRNKMPLEVVRDEWYETDPQSLYGSVEYTRTDAFVEKACEWLEENKDKYLYNTGGRYEYIPTCSGKMIDDFRNYMEGE